MPPFGPVSRRELIESLRRLGFDGPNPGSRHEFMVKGSTRITIPNPHNRDIGGPWLMTLRESGYRAHLAFLSLPSPELALIRVALRVNLGGHGVPEDVVRRRFRAGLRNFFDLYQQAVDTWQLFDNTLAGGPRLLASGAIGQPPEILDTEEWETLRRQR